MAEQYKLPMGIIEIEKILPHRYPFLLIDRVVEIEEGKSLVAIKQISFSDPILQGHFPGNPIVPGVLQIEAMAQASGILGMMITEQEQGQILLGEVENARFKRPVIPGDTLVMKVKLVKRRHPFMWFSGEARVDGKLTATVKISALLQKNSN